MRNMFAAAMFVVMVSVMALTQTPVPVDCHKPTWPCAIRQTNAQLTVIANPSPQPDLGNVIGANKTWKDPIRGTTILRCTDSLTGPGPYHSWEVTRSGGSGENDWNSDQTMLHGVAMATGHVYTIPFDAGSMTCGKANPFSAAGNARWSGSNPKLDYILVGTQVYTRTYDQVSPALVPPVISPVPLFDFKSCPGLASLVPKWTTDLQVTDDDSVLALGFSDRGGQDTGEYVAMYQPASNGCQVWNTLTGTVTGSGFGNSGTVSTFFPFTLHEVGMGPGGVIQAAVGNTCTGCPIGHGPFFFKAGSTTAGLVTRLFGGHGNMAWTTFCNITNQAAIACRLWNNLSNPVQITVNTGVHFPANTQSHMSWAPSVDVLDSYLMFMGTVTTDTPNLTITSPLQQSLWGANMDGTFTLIAPLLTSGIQMPGQLNFRTAYAIHTCGKKGICAWSSDNGGTFGNADGVTATCTLGAVGANQCASQILIAAPGQ